MRDISDENRTASYGEHAYITNLTDEELDEFIDDVYKCLEEKETDLANDYLTIALLEKELRELEEDDEEL